VLEDVSRAAEDLLDVGVVLVNRLGTLDIGMRARGARARTEDRIRIAFGMQNRSAFVQRLEGIEDRR